MINLSDFLNIAPEQITLELLRRVVEETPFETNFIEYKLSVSEGVIPSITAMANTYGGIILLGVSNEQIQDRFVGIREIALTQLVSKCLDEIDPQFTPEIREFKLDDRSELLIICIRVHPDKAPRPLVNKGRIYVRMYGQNQGADQTQIRNLFFAQNNRLNALQTYVSPITMDQEMGQMDLILKTGFEIPIDANNATQPLSELALESLGTHLSQSKFSDFIGDWCSAYSHSQITPFRRDGLSRSRFARYSSSVFSIANGTLFPALTAIFSINSMSQSLELRLSIEFSLELKISETTFREIYTGRTRSEDGIAGISPLNLYRLLDSIVATFLDENLMNDVSQISGFEKSQLALPTRIYLNMPNGIRQSLVSSEFHMVPGSADGHGSDLLRNLGFNLGDKLDRQQQIDQWIAQIVLDGGSLGATAALENLPACANHH